ncbi:FtsX-like permease family protein [Leifsonia sp. McL0607]|uniref:FtsX-like permease family protein n=1 Tax=Leifsonia sp. McL0607 TaxID=3415672 RepID=UPI003CED3DDB
MTTLRIAWLFTRRGMDDRSTIALPIVAFAIATALLLVVAGGARAMFAWNDEFGPTYQALGVVGFALLTVPLITLGGSAARLSARRRDDRLAGLRLLGATPAMVAALTVIESTVLAAVGVAAGIVLYLPASRLVGQLPFRGEALGANAYLPAGWVALCALGVVVIAASSAAMGLRGVIVSPLGVRTRQKAPRTHWVRAVIAVATVSATFTAMNMLMGGAFKSVVVIIVVLGVGFGGTIAVLNVVGPLILRLIALMQCRWARTAKRLIAARAVLESPKAAWRQVSGAAMTSFIAVFAGVGVGATRQESVAPDVMMLMTDVRTGVLVVVAISFLMIAVSAGVNQSAAILDRRDLYVSLDRIGMPVKQMNASRSQAVMTPLLTTTIGSALTALLVIYPIVKDDMSVLTSGSGLVTIVACLIGGIILVWLGLVATRPVLRRALTDGAATV